MEEYGKPNPKEGNKHMKKDKEEWRTASEGSMTRVSGHRRDEWMGE